MPHCVTRQFPCGDFPFFFLLNYFWGEAARAEDEYKRMGNEWDGDV